MRSMRKLKEIQRSPQKQCEGFQVYLARVLSLVSPWVWLGFAAASLLPQLFY
jgi:hypothetical protein